MRNSTICPTRTSLRSALSICSSPAPTATATTAASIRLPLLVLPQSSARHRCPEPTGLLRWLWLVVVCTSRCQPMTLTTMQQWLRWLHPVGVTNNGRTWDRRLSPTLIHCMWLTKTSGHIPRSPLSFRWDSLEKREQGKAAVILPLIDLPRSFVVVVFLSHVLGVTCWVSQLDISFFLGI